MTNKNIVKELKRKMIMDNPEDVPELNTFKMELARNLLRGRIYKNIDKEIISDTTGLSIVSINKMESGRFYPKVLDTIQKYIECLGFEIEINLILPEENGKK